MAKSIAQRLAALEKAVAGFIGMGPRKKKAKKAGGARKRTKKAKAKSARGQTARKTARPTARKTAPKPARGTARRRKSGRGAEAMAFPVG